MRMRCVGLVFCVSHLYQVNIDEGRSLKNEHSGFERGASWKRHRLEHTDCDRSPPQQFDRVSHVLETDREIVCSRHTEPSQKCKSIRSHFLSDEGCFMEAMPSLVSKLEGPPQEGRGQNGQYVYWICMVFPPDETVTQSHAELPHLCQ